MFNPVFVMTACAGREENVRCALTNIENQEELFSAKKVILIDDGGELDVEIIGHFDNYLYVPVNTKHEPGLEQPRNIGVHVVEMYYPDATHVWFVDSDVVLDPYASQAVHEAYSYGSFERVMVCPYEWLPPGVRPNINENFFDVAKRHQNDPRWQMFNTTSPRDEFRHDLSAGLACFSGNLVWNIEEFKRVGGYWNEIHHGRCEDGELGLRAISMDVPISFCAEARGFHLYHKINMPMIEAKNARDVPLLNERHPWVEKGGVLMVDRDGKSFDCKCWLCGKQVYTNQWWGHAAEHGILPSIKVEL